MSGLDDKDVFISTEAEELEDIELGYRVSKIVLTTFGVVICALELILIVQIVVNHW